MKHLFTCLLLLSFFLLAQTASNDTIPYNKTFVMLKNGTFLTGNGVKFENEFFRKKKIILDGKEFKPSQVRFYNDGTTLRGQFKRQFFLNCVHREKHLNFFEGVYEMSGNGKRSAFITYFYSKDLDPVRRLRTRSLVHDMQDDPLADQEIKRARKASWISIASIGGAYAGITGTVLLSSDVPVILLPIAIGGVITGVVFQFIRKRRTQHALIQYAPEVVGYQPKFFTRAQRKHYRAQFNITSN